jgi:hypothetical protein
MRKNIQGIGLGLAVALSGCGGGSSSDEEQANTPVSVLFSDAPVENAEKVVITVDAITFRRDGADDIVVDTFTSNELGIVDADTFQIDLLEVQGNDNRLVIDSVDLPVGDYSHLLISVLDEDVNLSYVEEVGTGALKPIKVPSDVLKLGGFTVGDFSTQTFVVEFGLRQSLVYNPGPPGQDRYILKPRGVRVVDLENASTIMGNVNLSALHTVAPCDAKADTQVDNMAYLYAGHGLDASLLGDVFVSQAAAEPGEDFDPNVPANVIAPVVAVDVEGGDVNGYLFSYLLDGDYTLALSCVATDDDPVVYNGIAIPAPGTEIVELSLGVEENLACDFPLVAGNCANNAP